jgi:sortase A
VALLVAGLGLCGWVGWQYFGTGISSNHQMDQGKRDLHDRWAAQVPDKAPKPAGLAVVLLRIPKFGKDWEKPVVEGIGKSDLANGIGHYPQTQLPGEPGNFALAGHRITHGAPFGKLLDLVKGDEVIVETADAVYTYQLDASPRDLTVKPNDTWVLDPVPGKPAEVATASILTLTTCQDLFHSPDRSVAFAHLTKVTQKT